jgi:GNAT superfamily N-acetyltransferase
MTGIYASLRNGTTVGLRPLRSTDRHALIQAFSDLSSESRYNRFFTQLDALPDQLLRNLVDVDVQDHVAWMATEPGSGRCLGVGRWIRVFPGAREAEAAIAVVDRYQSLGIATAVYERMRDSALAQGITYFVCHVLSTNSRALGILARSGAVIDRREHGVITMCVDLRRVRRPTPVPAAAPAPRS